MRNCINSIKKKKTLFIHGSLIYNMSGDLKGKLQGDEGQILHALWIGI